MIKNDYSIHPPHTRVECYHRSNLYGGVHSVARKWCSGIRPTAAFVQWRNGKSSVLVWLATIHGHELFLAAGIRRR